MGRFERAALTATAVVLEGVALLGEALRIQAITDFAVARWADLIERMDRGLNSR